MKPIKEMFKTLFKVDYPDTITTRKAKIVYWLNWQLCMKDQGAGIIMRFFSYNQELMLALLVIDRFFTWINITGLGVIIAIIVITLFLWLVGVIKIYYEIDKIEASIALVRNPFQRDLHKLVEKEDKDKL